jgi:hypothetical protein
MKYFLFFLLLPVFLKSQIFEKNFLNPLYFPPTGNQIHHYDTINGTYVVFGDLNSPTKGGLVKINKLGDTLWSKKLHLHQGKTFNPEGLILLNNSYLVVIGYSYGPNTWCCNSLYFDYYDLLGSYLVTDSITLGIAQGYNLQTIGPDNNGDYYLNYRNDILQGQTIIRNAILEKRNSNNVVVWQKQYSSSVPQGSSNYHTISDFAVTNDNSIYMLRNGAFVEKLNSSGVTQFTVNPGSLYPPSNINTVLPYKIIGLKDSSFIVESQVTDTSTVVLNLRNSIAHYSSSGVLIDSLTLSNIFFSSMTESNNGEIVCNYNIYAPSYSGAGILFLNSNLTIRNFYPFNLWSGIYNTGKLSANNVGGAFYTCGYSSGNTLITQVCSFDSLMNTYPNKILGSVHLDNDKDCNNSIPDYNLTGNLISASNGSMQSFISITNSIGDYTLTLPNNTYTLQHIPATNKLNSCGGYSVSLITTGTTTLTKNYFDTLVPNIKDMQVVSFLSSKKPGDNTFLYVFYQNNGTNTVSANISIVKDSSFQFINASSPLSSISGDTLIYSFNNLKPDSSGQLILSFIINPSLPLGSNLSLVSSCFQNNDISPWDNVDSISTQASMWSPKNSSASTGFDANSIQVDKPFLIDGNETLVYKINFQNTNKRSVKKLVIMDSLNKNLDLTTFKIIKSSHSISNIRIEKNILYVVYENINLPDSATSSSHSNGFLVYSIKPKSSLPLGTLINNRSSFAFDLFPLKNTNNVVNKINRYVVGIKENNPHDQNLLLFPNPTNDQVVLMSNTIINSIELITLEGKVVMTSKNINAKETTLHLGHLSQGLYLMKISTENEFIVKKVSKN